MKVSFDPDADALMIRFGHARILETEEIRPGVMFDYDADGRIAGIEMIGASKLLSPRAIDELEKM